MIKYNKFISLLKNRFIYTCYIDTTKHTAYIFTEPLEYVIFIYPQIYIYG